MRCLGSVDDWVGWFCILLMQRQMDLGKEVLRQMIGMVGVHGEKIERMEEQNKQIELKVEGQERVLHEHRDSIMEQELRIDGVEVGVKLQEEKMVQTILAVDEKLSQQYAMIIGQEAQLAKLLSVRARSDMVADGAILIFSFWMIQSALVRYPLRLLLSLFFSPNNDTLRRRFFSLSIKMILGWMLLTKLRDVAADFGFHSKVGSPVEYAVIASSLLHSLGQYISQALFTQSKPKTPLSSTSDVVANVSTKTE